MIIRLLLTALLGLFVLPTSAQTTCSNGGASLLNQPPNQGNGVFSDTDCDFCTSGGGSVQVIADDILLAADTAVAEIEFWGGYFPADVPSTPDNFIIYIHADNAGLPGAVTQTLTGLSLLREATGVVLFGVDQYRYVATLASPVVLAAGPHWISIVNATTGNTDSWFWESGDWDSAAAAVSGAFAFESPGLTWTVQPEDFAMQVCGVGRAVTSSGSVAPEAVPIFGFWGLLALVASLGLLGAHRTRKRAR